MITVSERCGRSCAAALVVVLLGGLLGLTTPAARAAAAVVPAAGSTDCGAAAPWCAARSRPRVDSYYPGPSRGGVDALHYHLALRWSPARHRLDGNETLVLRAATTGSSFRLALGRRMHVTSASVDGRRVGVVHDGDGLRVRHPINRGSVYRLELDYHGSPPAAPPVADQRNAVGMYRTPADDVFTNDEPVGAFRWYAVNDQPSDKAFYDFRLSTPAPRVGVANGRLVARHRLGQRVVTRFRLDRPASSYLITVEFGRYRMTRLRPVHGVPLTLWTPRGDRATLEQARTLRPALVWVEKRLGRYPFDALSMVVVPGYDSGMENQTLITVGRTEYDLSYGTVLHEVVHQWYGDLVTPRDWRDAWMNEGMAMYLQFAQEAQSWRIGLHQRMRWIVESEREGRARYGPPAAYHRTPFAAVNIYYSPALMWDQLRGRVGDRAFWSMVRDWPRVHAYGNAGREDYLPWIQRRLHRDLGRFFHRWLLGRTSPRVGR